MNISLALGGGGSRGFAHLGVLRTLEKEGYHIRAIAGTSAGGIVAVGYAAGYSPDEMETIFMQLDQSKLFARSPKDGPGILGLSGAAKLFKDLFGERTFAELRIPCAVVAVELSAGREVVINQGRVVDAVLATIAVPGVFPPRQFGNSQLVDGAVLNPVPVSVARLLEPRLPIIAVVLNTKAELPGGITSFSLPLPIPLPVPAPIVERLTRTRVAQAFNIFLQSVDVSSRKMAELRLQMDSPDVVIRPDVEGIGLLDTVDIQKVVKKGDLATKKMLPELRRALRWQNRLIRRISHN